MPIMRRNQGRTRAKASKELTILHLPDGSWICYRDDDEFFDEEYSMQVFSPNDLIEKYNAREISMIHHIMPIWNSGDFLVEFSRKIIVHDDLFDGGVTVSDIPVGIYKARDLQGFITLSPMELRSDSYIDLNEGIKDNLMSDIDDFFHSREKYVEMGLLYKRGFLFYGKAGNGKTMLVNEVVKKYKDVARIIFISDCGIIENSNNFENYRKLFQNQLVLFIVEELSQLLMGAEASEEFLSFLDGQTSWKDMLFIATTNYPERIAPNLIDRPSRFDRIINFPNPDEKTRKRYLETILKDEVSDEFINKTDGFSIAHLKEICIQIIIHNKTFETIIKEMNERKTAIKQNFAENQGETETESYM